MSEPAPHAASTRSADREDAATDPAAAFIGSLDDAIRDMIRLEAVMLEETQAIASQDIDALQGAIDEQRALMAGLETETARQRGWIEDAGFAFTPEGIERFIQAIDQGNRVADRWSTLLGHMRRCDQANQDNARLIDRDRRRIATTLSILRGEDASTTTYDPKGRTASGGPRGRTISQA